jgi:hypothetical protein
MKGLNGVNQNNSVYVSRLNFTSIHCNLEHEGLATRGCIGAESLKYS